jgi:hypothetical protein
MTEDEWLKGRDPRKLYAYARRLVSQRLKRGRRRLRLYACACCRQIWHLLGDASRAAVEVGERYADDRADRAELTEASRAAWKAWQNLVAGRPVPGLQVPPVKLVSPEEQPRAAGRRKGLQTAAGAAFRTVLGPKIARHAGQVAVRVRWAARLAAAEDPKAAHAQLGRTECALLRDLFGNPFRPPPAVDPAWLTWNGGTVAHLARSIYDEGAFDRMPVLADALEEAGCTDAEILIHCRGGPHVRGCWLVDALLRRD